MNADAKTPMLHNEGLTTRNYTNYNFEVLRDDIYMLGVDSTVTPSHRAYALQLRGDCQFAERQSRLALLHAADHLGGRLQRLCIQPVLSAHGARAETKSAPIVMSPRATTTTRGWRNC